MIVNWLLRSDVVINGCFILGLRSLAEGFPALIACFLSTGPSAWVVAILTHAFSNHNKELT